MNFILVIESRDFKVCQKNRLRPISMKRYDVRGRRVIDDDMTFNVIRGQGQGQGQDDDDDDDAADNAGRQSTTTRATCRRSV